MQTTSAETHENTPVTGGQLLDSNMPAPEEMPETHVFAPAILRAYDVRGVLNENLTVTDAYFLGRAFATLLKRRGGDSVCVGYDGRPSSPYLAQALMAGLSASGMHVESLGLGPTPMTYFAIKDRLRDGGIMVTGSHNPPEYNGFKFMFQHGSFFGDAIQELGRIAAEGDLAPVLPAEQRGQVKDVNIKQDYLKRLIQDMAFPDADLKMAWDCGNGATGEIVQELVRDLPGTHHVLYAEIDGTFPNHHPDPTQLENLRDLRNKVLQEKCHLGVAFDGDGDRIGVVDEKGEVIWGDRLMALFARDVLATYPGAPIIADVKCSETLFQEIARNGGDPVMWMTGHSLVKSKMAETNAPLAGELSGHIFFADRWYGFDDAIYATLRLLNIMARDENTQETCPVLSGFFTDIPSVPGTPEIRIDVPEERKFEIVQNVRDQMLRRLGTDNVDTLDGLRVRTESGWWLLRASNTQNALVLRAEAETQNALNRILEDLRSMLAAEDVEVPA